MTVLTSGGLDSAACLAYYRARGDATKSVWVNYGQAAARSERRAARRVATHYRVPFVPMELRGISWAPSAARPSEYPARNLTLAALGLNVTRGPGLVALGVHAGSGYADCSEGFATRLDDLAALLTEGLVRVECPFLTWSKLDVAGWAHQAGVPSHLTYSCERGSEPPCGGCEKCLERSQVEAILSRS